MLMVIIFMGYGLIKVPREIMLKRNLDHTVRRSYYKLGTSAITLEKLYSYVELKYHVAATDSGDQLLVRKDEAHG